MSQTTWLPVKFKLDPKSTHHEWPGFPSPALQKEYKFPSFPAVARFFPWEIEYVPSKTLNSKKLAQFPLFTPPVIVMRIYLAVAVKLSSIVCNDKELDVLLTESFQTELSVEVSILY